MPVATVDATKVTFSNAGVALDDTENLSDGNFGVQTFDVMSNDGGGAAKTLWSLDDGHVDSPYTGKPLSSNFANYDTDLLKQDTATSTTTLDTSVHGAKIWIEGGKVKYDSSTLDAAFKAQLGHLGVHDAPIYDTFEYTIRLANGTLSVSTVSIAYQGTNDGVSIVLAGTDAAGDVTEDNNVVLGKLSDTGTVAFTDPDYSDTHTATATHLTGTLGGSLTMGTVSESASTADGSVAWTYSVDNSATQYLGATETAQETFKVTIDDGNGSHVDQTVTVTVHGANDDVAIVDAGTDAAGDVTEDNNVVLGKLSDTGTVAFTDPDYSDTHTATATHLTGTLGGSLTMGTVSESASTADGSVGWTYSVDNSATQHLGQGITATETFKVTIDDNHGGAIDQTMTITVTGVNDAAEFSGDATGAVTEDGPLTTGGTLVVDDVDDGESVFASTGNLAGSHGTFTFDLGTGAWTYALNNSDPALATLDAADAPLTDSLLVTSADGSTDTITVTINGADEAASTVHHTGSQAFSLGFTGPQDGSSHADPTLTIQLPDGFNFSGSADLTVTGDIDAANEHVFFTFEGGSQQDATHAATGSESFVDVLFSSADSTVTLTYHTSDQVEGPVQIVGTLDYTYETLV